MTRSNSASLPYKVLRKVKNRAGRLKRNADMFGKWLGYELGQTAPLMYPQRMYIESTNVCNLRCVMCPTGRREVERKKGYMDIGLFKSIVDEMAPHVQATTLHIWGEPLLHPKIFEMIAYCRQKGLRSEMSTNATLLTEEKARKILEAGLDVIYLCMDGATKDTYEAIRRRANFEETQANIRRFMELRRELGLEKPQINLQIIQMAQTQAEVEAFLQQWTIPGVDRLNVKPFDSWASQIDEIEGLRAQDDTTFSVPTQRYACPNLWYHVHIYWNGDLAMCDRDFNLDTPLGNVVSAGGVMNAWRGQLFQQLRRQHLDGNFSASPCNGCTEWAWWKPTPLGGGQGNRPDNTAALNNPVSQPAGGGGLVGLNDIPVLN
jgi:organic radical activating enzyme